MYVYCVYMCVCVCLSKGKLISLNSSSHGLLHCTFFCLFASPVFPLSHSFPCMESGKRKWQKKVKEDDCINPC